MQLKLTTLVRLNVHILNNRHLARLHLDIAAMLILNAYPNPKFLWNFALKMRIQQIQHRVLCLPRSQESNRHHQRQIRTKFIVFSAWPIIVLNLSPIIPPSLHPCNLLTSDTILSYFDPHKNATILVDAKPVLVPSYAIKIALFSPVEQCYSQTEREALAVLFACEHFHLHINGTQFSIITDHKPLERIFPILAHIPMLA